MTEMPRDAREAARKRIEERRGFVPHLIIYLVVNTGLILLAGAWSAYAIASWTRSLEPGTTRRSSPSIRC